VHTERERECVCAHFVGQQALRENARCTTERQRVRGCLIFIGHFSQKSPNISHIKKRRHSSCIQRSKNTLCTQTAYYELKESFQLHELNESSENHELNESSAVQPIVFGVSFLQSPISIDDSVL